jgi:O-acetyl-ADP-ribose deacetylase (regulator of RNase III)
VTVRIEAVRGDITSTDVDVVVNAANSGLLGGGGVDGAIHAAAGPELLEECRLLRRTEHVGGLPAGEAVATGAGRLSAAFVVHTVGPKHWEHPDGGRALLASCHRRSLEVTDGLEAASVAFPAISCGVYGWSADAAAPIAVAAVREYAASHPSSTIELVRFVLFSDETLAAFTAAVASPLE